MTEGYVAATEASKDPVVLVLGLVAGMALAAYGWIEARHAQTISDRYSRDPLYEPRWFPLFRFAMQWPLGVGSAERRERRPSPRRLRWDGCLCLIVGCAVIVATIATS